MSIRLYSVEPSCFRDLETLEYLTTPCNIISLLSILFVFFIYYYIPHIRTFDFRLLLYLQISDFIWSFSLLFTQEARKNSILCRAQSFFIDYSALSSIFWTILISKSIYDSLGGYLVISKKLESILLILSFLIPGFIAFIPFFFDAYGNSIYWCWIREDNEISISTRNLLMIFTFYAYAWIAIIYNFYNYIRIFRIQKKFIHNHGILKKIDGIYLDKLMFIPLIFLFIWLFGTIDRVLECFKICNFTVSVIHAMMESLNGFANTLLYVCNKDIRKEVKNIFSNKVVGETEITN